MYHFHLAFTHAVHRQIVAMIIAYLTAWERYNTTEIDNDIDSHYGDSYTPRFTMFFCQQFVYFPTTTVNEPVLSSSIDFVQSIKST